MYRDVNIKRGAHVSKVIEQTITVHTAVHIWMRQSDLTLRDPEKILQHFDSNRARFLVQKIGAIIANSYSYFQRKT